MSVKREWLFFFVIIIVAAVVLLNLRSLGLSVVNTTSNVSVGIVNSAPSITYMNSSLFVCEDDILYHEFNATDSDGDSLSASISPTNPFFVFWITQPAISITTFAIVSGVIDKGDIGGINSWNRTYAENVSVSDDYVPPSSDYELTNITVIEINHAPVIEDVGVKTIWNRGENSTLNETVSATDFEYDRGYGSLTFNLTMWNSSNSIVEMFNITSSGVINFTANTSTTLGTYTVQVCVNDTGLTNPFVNISSICGQTGGSMRDCDNFTLTITDSNRAPNITGYSPDDLNFSSPGTSPIEFIVNVSDPDGTIPDAYWYVDGVFIERDEGSSSDSFTHTFGCDVSGYHTVRVNVTDGLLNDTLSWNVSVQTVSCSSGGGGTGGGGGGGGAGIVSERFSVEPLFITTKIFKGEGKSFDITIKNVGSVDSNVTVGSENLSDLALISENNLSLKIGEEKTIRVYLYSLSTAKPGVYYGKIFFQGKTAKVSVSIVLEVKDREPLFDIAVEVLPDYKTVNAGDDVRVRVDMLNVGLYGTAVDVEFYLFVTDFNKLIIYETSKELVAVEKNVSLLRDLRIPLDTASGNYLVLAQASYGNVSATSYDTFVVVEKKYLRAAYFLILIFILLLLFFILFLIWKRRKKKEEDRYR